MTSLLWIALGVVLAVAAMWYWPRAKRRLPTWKKLRRRAGAAVLRKKVFRLAPDPSAAERLIERERERHPELGEAALLRKVLRRLERDRRR